jgi:hypothetical protein
MFETVDGNLFAFLFAALVTVLIAAVGLYAARKEARDVSRQTPPTLQVDDLAGRAHRRAS